MKLNLLKQVTDTLNRKGKSLRDIRQVQGEEVAITVDDFISLAAVTVYDEYMSWDDVDGDGHHLAEDLTIVGDSWWIDILEIDRDEFGCHHILQYHQMPEIVTNIKKVNMLSCDSSELCTLDDFVV